MTPILVRSRQGGCRDFPKYNLIGFGTLKKGTAICSEGLQANVQESPCRILFAHSACNGSECILRPAFVHLHDIRIGACLCWNYGKHFSALFLMMLQVEMPKFRLEQSFSLNGVLQRLGMVDMFSDSLADFSKITGQKDLVVSAVIHKAFIEVRKKCVIRFLCL